MNNILYNIKEKKTKDEKNKKKSAETTTTDSFCSRTDSKHA